ncbi:hypothetical protein [Sphingobium sp. MK2]|uniref:hypothetical protein n=1 Tax=Sphingobium sp. MK2 TaxID=3116540 RepID=UPI0032E3656A
MRDYEIHLDCDQLSSLFNPEEESERLPFWEDPEELEKMINEEVGRPRRRRRKV